MCVYVYVYRSPFLCVCSYVRICYLPHASANGHIFELAHLLCRYNSRMRTLRGTCEYKCIFSINFVDIYVCDIVNWIFLVVHIFKNSVPGTDD